MSSTKFFIVKVERHQVKWSKLDFFWEFDSQAPVYDERYTSDISKAQQIKLYRRSHAIQFLVRIMV